MLEIGGRVREGCLHVLAREMGYIVGAGGMNDIDGGDNDSEQLFMCV